MDQPVMQSVPNVPVPIVGRRTIGTSVLNIQVSYFRTKADKQPQLRSLRQVLTDQSRALPVARLREVLQSQSKEAYDTLKLSQPAFLVSVLVEGGHHTDCVKGTTGLMAIDIDAKDNPGWTPEELKRYLLRCRNVAYGGLSLSGEGVWCIIPISRPDKHRQHFRALERLFRQLGEKQKGRGYGIVIDTSCKNPNRLRFHSYDPAPVWRDNAETFQLFDEPTPTPFRPVQTYSTGEDESHLLDRLVRHTQAADEGQRHATLLKWARLAGGYVAAGRLDEQTAVCALETVASEWPNFPKSQKTIRDGIRNGSASPIYSEIGSEGSVRSG